MFPSLLPKSVPFFDMLGEQNSILRGICTHARSMLEDANGMDTSYREIAILEAQGDRLHAKIIFELSRAFITPIDREDILRITQSQEGCMDCFQRLSTRLHIFEFSRIRFPILRLSQLSGDMLNLTRLMLEGLAKHHDCHKTRAFDELREEADMVMATGLAELTDTQGEWTPQAVMDALKWSQVLECMETCLEHISDLGEIIEGAVLKYV